MDEELYNEREQSYIKHIILESYLGRFAHIIGSFYKSITYVDTFTGPWESQSDEFEDTGFSIAINEFQKAQQNPKSKNDFYVRYCFVEKNSESFNLLKQHVIKAELLGQTKLINNGFESSISDIKEFIEQDKSTFPFFFIDPKGWKDIPLKEAIAPLALLEPSEILINFMTSFIKRFPFNEPTQQSYKNLFGCDNYQELIQAEKQIAINEEEALVQVYCNQVKKICNYKYVARAIILNPEKDKTHYHLIYGTRNPKGLEVFKGAEKKAMEAMEKKRKENTDPYDDEQQLQFDMAEAERIDSYYAELRNMYLEHSRNKLCRVLKTNYEHTYETLYDEVLIEPLTWKTDLDNWLKAMKSDGELKITGLEPGKKALNRNRNIKIHLIDE